MNLRHLFRPRPRPGLVMSVAVHPVERPIPPAEREPAAADRSPSDWAWWGHWESGRWVWMWDDEPWEHHSHWLPAGVEVLPVRCYAPQGVE